MAIYQAETVEGRLHSHSSKYKVALLQKQNNHLSAVDQCRNIDSYHDWLL